MQADATYACMSPAGAANAPVSSALLNAQVNGPQIWTANMDCGTSMMALITSEGG